MNHHHTQGLEDKHHSDVQDHSHGAMGHAYGPRHGLLLGISFTITMLFVLGEALAGYIANSLALMSDAGHNFSDALALGLAAYAVWISKKPANAKKTFGYHRVAMLTALFNAVTLVVIAIWIFAEAIHLFREPEQVNGMLMMWVAAAAFIMNTAIAYLLMGEAKKSLNMKAAFIHMAGDAASSLVVVIAGFLVHKTGWQYMDPAVSLLIGAFIAYTSWGIIKEASDVLLEGTPKSLDVALMVEQMKSLTHVQEVHDIHAWTVSDGMHYLACHVVVGDARTMAECALIIEELNNLLSCNFGINHATIQIEMNGACGNEAVFCQQLTKTRNPDPNNS